MRAGILSTGLWSLGSPRQATQEEKGSATERYRSRSSRWDEHEFRHEQICGLIRKVFLPGPNPRVRQVVFGAIEPETDVYSVSKQVGELLAAQTAADVAFVDESHSFAEAGYTRPLVLEDLKEYAERVTTNFFLPHRRSLIGHGNCTPPLHWYFKELRRQFEYSIVAAPPASTSTELFKMAHYSDGIVLVLSAQCTRRMSALKLKKDLGQARLLGTVLSEREFPIPWEIYRRL